MIGFYAVLDLHMTECSTNDDRSYGFIDLNGMKGMIYDAASLDDVLTLNFAYKLELVDSISRRHEKRKWCSTIPSILVCSFGTRRRKYETCQHFTAPDGSHTALLRSVG